MYVHFQVLHIVCNRVSTSKFAAKQNEKTNVMGGCEIISKSMPSVFMMYAFFECFGVPLYGFYFYTWQQEKYAYNHHPQTHASCV